MSGNAQSAQNMSFNLEVELKLETRENKIKKSINFYFPLSLSH